MYGPVEGMDTRQGSKHKKLSTVKALRKRKTRIKVIIIFVFADL